MLLSRMGRSVRVLLALAAVVTSTACGLWPGSGPVTYTKHVAPILDVNCVTCHRPGEAAPFALQTFKDAVAHGDDIDRAIASRHMPPWLPDRADVTFVGERRLRPEQIEIIHKWIADGMPEGRAADRPSPPSYPDGWALGTPDAVLTTAQPYPATPSTDDVYRNLVFRTSLTEDTWVRAVEFRTNGSPIHHAVIRLDRTSSSRVRDGRDGKPGFDGMSPTTAQDPVGQFVGWAPGRGPIVSPEGLAWRLERGTDLVVELHLSPTTKAAQIAPSIALYFTKAAPTRTAAVGKLTSKTIDIPAGARDYTVSDTFEVPVDADLLSVYPHAHYLATTMVATATFPDGSTRKILNIPRWSFHWQQDYQLATPLRLPRGTRLAMTYTFDNSDSNPDNPSRPPKRVQIGPRSVDEMAEFTVQLSPVIPSDVEVLAQAFDTKELAATLAMAEMRVRNTPDNAEFLGFLGSTYVEAQRFADAVAPLQRAVALAPTSATAFADLGSALLALHRTSDALAALQRAAALAPKDETIQFNLGNALGQSGRVADAEAAFRRSLAINPDFPDALLNLGALLLQRGQAGAALPYFQRAVAVMPGSAFTHASLSSAYGALGRYAESLAEARRALAIRPGFPPAEENLKRLQQLGIR